MMGAIVWLGVAWTTFVFFSTFGGGSTLTYSSMSTSTSDVVIAAFALLAAVLLSAGAYLVYIAPDVLSQAALQVAVATGLVRPAKNPRKAGWVGGVFKSTRWLFVLVALVAFLLGSSL